MRKLLTVAIVVLALTFWPAAALASDVECPLHPYASCYDTGRVASSGAHLWHCSCGDNVWVGDSD